MNIKNAFLVQFVTVMKAVLVNAIVVNIQQKNYIQSILNVELNQIFKCALTLQIDMLVWNPHSFATANALTVILKKWLKNTKDFMIKQN